MYLQLSYFNSSHVLILVSKEEETEHSRLILIDLMSVGPISAQNGVSVPWKIDHLMKVPDTEEELFSIGLTKDKKFDCYTFTLVKGNEGTSVVIKTHRQFQIPYCKYRYSVFSSNLYKKNK